MRNGIIIIQHSILRNITRDECVNALPKEWLGLDRIHLEVKPTTLDLSELYDAFFEQIALEQRSYFAKEIAPVLAKYPDYKIIYFGLAPIALSMDLGYQFRNIRDIYAFQFHHSNKKWYLDLGASNENKLKLNIQNIPEQKQKGIQNLLVRFSISHPIKVDDTGEILNDAAEVDINIDSPNEDAISTNAEMNLVVDGFKNTLDEISHNESSVEVIHLFPAINCGVAFLSGTKISPNIHPLIQVYQYSATKTPKYKKALLIKGELRDERVLTAEQLAEADSVRVAANETLVDRIRPYMIKNETDSKGRGWLLGATGGKADATVLNDKSWKELPSLYQTSLKNDEFDFSKKDINDGFYWNENRWYIDDHFLLAIKKRLKDTDKILKAIRLFLFHEALHYRAHRLTETRAVNIGSFPKVIEAADYQADVYALINEYGYALHSGSTISSDKSFFLEAIEVATETMWSFDDNGRPLSDIQIRRLNRYIIWYWQYVRIQKEGDSLDQILRILEERPVIEINGLKTLELNNRFFFNLNERRGYLELAMFRNNEIKRSGSASNMSIENLIEGIKSLNGQLIINVLKSFLDS